jgi:hypothetical protein
MKHTDFFKKIREIEAQEQLELIKAIMAYGGKFNWDEDTEQPIIAINPDSVCPSPIDVEVNRVIVNNGHLKIFGSEKECGYEIEFDPEDAFTGHLSSIIDYIPDTENISDVTAQEFFKTTSVSRDDLEIVGDYGLHETIFDMAQYAREITESGIYDSRMIASEVIGWAKEFREKYRNEDWTDLDYYETIHSFATNKIKEFTDNHI